MNAARIITIMWRLTAADAVSVTLSAKFVTLPGHATAKTDTCGSLRGLYL